MAQLFAQTKQGFRHYDALSTYDNSTGKSYLKCRFSISLHAICVPCGRDRASTDLIDSSEDFKSLLIFPSLLIEDGTSLVSRFVD